MIETVKVNGTALTPSSKAVDITVPSVGNGTITITQNGTTKGTFTTNQSGNTTIALTDNNTTYGVATSSALGLVKSGTDITVDSSGNVRVNDDSHNHVISNIDGLQSALDGKAASSHNQASSTINAMTGYTKASSVAAIATSDSLNTAIGKLEKALDGKAASSHGTHVPATCSVITDWDLAYNTGWYMGNSASNAPSTAWYFGYVIAHNANYVIQEVYQFTASTDAKAIPKYIRAKMNGTWVSWTEVTVQKKVPSNAKFTDTNTWRGIQNNLTSDSTTDSLSAAQGKVLKGLVDGKAAKSHGNHVPATQTANNAVFLRNDNTWQTVTPANIGAAASSHTHSAMKGATSSAAGTSGLVPAPAAGDQEKFLRADGTWQKAGGSSGDCLPLTGGVVSGNVQQSGGTTDYTTYKFRNIGFGTTSTPTSNSTYGGNGSIYFQYS